jgi:hypothetical protein
MYPNVISDCLADLAPTTVPGNITEEKRPFIPSSTPLAYSPAEVPQPLNGLPLSPWLAAAVPTWHSSCPPTIPSFGRRQHETQPVAADSAKRPFLPATCYDKNLHHISPSCVPMRRDHVHIVDKAQHSPNNPPGKFGEQKFPQ